MGTTGMISICVLGKVALKLITDTDGDKVNALADFFLLSRVLPEAEWAYESAIGFGFDAESVIVISPSRALFYGDRELHPDYRESFIDEYDHPGTDTGTPDYLRVLHF